MNTDTSPASTALHNIRSQPIFSLLLLACFAQVVILSFSGLENLVQRWQSQAEYSHGYLIPLVALYILWERRACLRLQFSAINFLGLAFAFVAIVLLFLGEISALFLLMHISIVLLLIALSCIVLGKNTKHSVAALLFLLFAVPLPYFLEALLTSQLQLFSSSIGVNIIRWFGIPVYLDGNIIDLGSFKLHVVEACSGLRYLFPLISIGVVIAYFYRATFWKKSLLVVSCIPIAIAMNSIRIAMTGVLVKYIGNDSAEGFIHAFEGWVVFLICLALLLLLVLALEALGTKNNLLQAFSAGDPKEPTGVAGHAEIKKINVLLAGFAVLLALAIVGIKIVDRRADNTPLHASFALFPLELKQWQGQRDMLDREVREALGFDDYFLANYSSYKGKVNVYVAYYENQRKGVSPHSPKVCIPGGGWEINNIQIKEVHGIKVNEVEIQKGLQRQLVYYWFVERGVPIASEYTKKWWLLRDAIIKGRTDGALVRLVANVDVGASGEDEYRLAVERLDAFLAQVQVPLNNYLPSP